MNSPACRVSSLQLRAQTGDASAPPWCEWFPPADWSLERLVVTSDRRQFHHRDAARGEATPVVSAYVGERGGHNRYGKVELKQGHQQVGGNEGVEGAQ